MLGRPFFETARQKLLSAGDAEHLVAKEALDGENGFEVLGPVAALTALGADRVQIGMEFLFPVAEGMGLHLGDAARRADADGLLGPCRSRLDRHSLCVPGLRAVTLVRPKSVLPWPPFLLSACSWEICRVPQAEKESQQRRMLRLRFGDVKADGLESQ